MKEGFRQSMDWLHTWLGLVVGWILFFVYLTGTLGYLDTEIDYWMTPDKPFMDEQSPVRTQIDLGQARLQSVASVADSWTIQLAGGREARNLEIGWVENGARYRETLHPVTGEPFDNSARDTGGGQLLYKMHYNLAYLPLTPANFFIMICSIIMFAAMITGIIVHKKIFRELFTFRPGKGQRSWLDGHNILGVTSLPFHLMVTYSGLLFFIYIFMPAAPHLMYDDGDGSVALQLYRDTYGAPRLSEQFSPADGSADLVRLSPLMNTVEQHWGPGKVTAVDVRFPGNAASRVVFRPLPSETVAFPDYSLIFDGATGELIEDYPGPYIHPAGFADQAMKGLHKGLFAGPFLRGLYLFMGLAGTVMIGAGLLLWSHKRKHKLRLQGREAHFGIKLVDRLNLSTVIGQPIAIAAYFWANRLLPAEMATRADWEVHIMFLTLAAMLLYPVIRPLARAWVDMLWLAAAAYCLVPVLNALTTNRHLGISLFQGDWIMAGFDLTALACGILFGIFALKLQRRQSTALQVSTGTDAAPGLATS